MWSLMIFGSLKAWFPGSMPSSFSKDKGEYIFFPSESVYLKISFCICCRIFAEIYDHGKGLRTLHNAIGLYENFVKATRSISDTYHFQVINAIVEGIVCSVRSNDNEVKVVYKSIVSSGCRREICPAKTNSKINIGRNHKILFNYLPGFFEFIFKKLHFSARGFKAFLNIYMSVTFHRIGPFMGDFYKTSVLSRIKRSCTCAQYAFN